MSIKNSHILILSDTNQSNFSSYLSKYIKDAKVVTTPFNQLMQVLINPTHAVWQQHYALIIFWANPKSLFPDLEKTLIGKHEMLHVKNLFLRLMDKAERVLFTGFENYPNGFYSQFENISSHNRYALNMMLTSISVESPGVVSYLPGYYSPVVKGLHAVSEDLWYLSKTAWHRTVTDRMASFVADMWKQWHGLSVKLIITDLDDTLWGGIVGDDGWEQLRLGGHDAVGESFSDTQQQLLIWKKRGILLAIASKNDEETALQAIDRHPEMKLRKADFSTWRINWEDKALNIQSIITELNIGAQHTLFMDDNPVERYRVAQAFPDMIVPNLPANKLEVPAFLRSLSCIPATGVLTNEDMHRAELYVAEQQRKNSMTAFSGIDEWIQSLNTVVSIEKLSHQNLTRAAQLLNKTNQMNLRTRRLSEDALWNWSQTPGQAFYTAHVHDKFGDAGLTGLIGVSIHDDELFVEDFVLSCRVMGRGIEETLMNFIISLMTEWQLSNVKVACLLTPKNKPCRDFFSRYLLSDSHEWVFDSKARFAVSGIQCNVIDFN